MEDEELSEEQIENYREQARAAGMVGSDRWEATFTTLMNDMGIEDGDLIGEAFEGVKKAAKATCFVCRREGENTERYECHEKQANRQDLQKMDPEAWAYHNRMKDKKTKIGS